MRIHHIFHSGFLVITRHSALLFDWYTGDLPQIPRDRRLYVFCSHAHADHYSPRIWELQIDHPEVIYILDEGIEDANHHPEARIVTVAPQMCYEIDGRIIRHCSLERWNYGSREEGESDPGSPGEDAAIRLHTLESTDMGVAFCVETEGRRIYHAGDLNVWYWNDEPMEDNIASEHKCCEQMQILADMYRHEPAQTGEGAGLHQDHGRKEDLIDKYESKTGEYLIQLTKQQMDSRQTRKVTMLLRVVGDLERIGDYASNIARVTNEIHDGNISFSEDARKDLNVAIEAERDLVNSTVAAYQENDFSTALRIKPCAAALSYLCEILKARHIGRLSRGECNLTQGTAYTELLNSFERIGSHCVAVSGVVRREIQANPDIHVHSLKARELSEQQYQQIYDEFLAKYDVLSSEERPLSVEDEAVQ